MQHRRPLLIPGLLIVTILISCATNPKPITAPTLPQNAKDTADATAFRTIADAWAFISNIRASAAACTTPDPSHNCLQLSANQKTAFNNTVTAYNVAYATGLAYHNGSNTSATTLNAATTNLSNKLTTAKIAIPQ